MYELGINSEEDIKKILTHKYQKTDPVERRLEKFVTKDTVGDQIVFYILQGSPPKGYAIQTGDTITFLDVHKKSFKTLYGLVPHEKSP